MRIQAMWLVLKRNTFVENPRAMFDHLSFTFVRPHPRRKPRGWVPVCAMLLCLCISPAFSPQPALAAPVLSPVDPVHETGS
ncbi:MAG: hypothetical protein Q4A31_11350 [Corynebacterium sp.]|uniref:hypothetical protein n=1 Tax=Corynebacterium sp. TaxID=1720 RepID=UPI0026DDA950|nr:hypothetical protein [Corynebacterium sp.]MDO4762507.1 hypothetical protein [Corynebacterium sp.]